MTVQAQIVLKTTDGLSENFVSNTLYFIGISPEEATLGLAPILKDFYDDIRPWLGPSLAQSNHVIKMYDPDLPKPNYPFAETTFNLAVAPAGGGLPTEVALVLSFQGARISGASQASRRGRIYLGPLNQSSLDPSGLRPSGAVVLGAIAAYETMADAVAILPALGTGFPAVRSQKLGTDVAVSNGWIDNAFDTQRRRGVAPSGRNTFDIIV
uniref:Uncharacterized protein n=1 Tax=uncultured prokaryote TaxID=198431 RepID=A0A0H5QGY8_9ZZZZ|nr:hypothetical protein [uncultured prokaryote]